MSQPIISGVAAGGSATSFNALDAEADPILPEAVADGYSRWSKLPSEYTAADLQALAPWRTDESEPALTTPPARNSATALPLSGNILTDSLLQGTKWGEATPGTGATLTFSFKTPETIAIGPGNTTYPNAPWYLNDAQKQAVRDALAEWAKVANVTFTEVTETPDALADLRFGGTNNTPEFRAAEANYLLPGYDAENGTVWLGKKFQTPELDPALGGLSPGSYGFMALMHEIGHALGLKHPHDAAPANSLLTPLEHDTQRATLMSYKLKFSVSPSTLQAQDIAAIQYLYGANTQHSPEDTVYQFGSNTPVFQTLWDPAGTNTLDASQQTAPVSLDLNAGARSSIGAMIEDNNTDTILFGMPWEKSRNDFLVIAPGTTIQNATGSPFDDWITGNAAANVIDGGQGYDTLDGGQGDDRIQGGTGDDTITGGEGTDRAVYRISTTPLETQYVADPEFDNYWHVLNKEGRALLDIWQTGDGAGLMVRDARADQDIPEGESRLGLDLLTGVEWIDWSEPIVTPTT